MYLGLRGKWTYKSTLNQSVALCGASPLKSYRGCFQTCLCILFYLLDNVELIIGCYIQKFFISSISEKTTIVIYKTNISKIIHGCLNKGKETEKVFV